jgi:hypothetical protein
LCAWNNSRTDEQILIKYDIQKFCENFSEKLKFWQRMYKHIGLNVCSFAYLELKSINNLDILGKIFSKKVIEKKGTRTYLPSNFSTSVRIFDIIKRIFTPCVHFLYYDGVWGTHEINYAD